MSKFTQNIKNFFQKKPVRIITAITIIAGIMTGIAFGLIAIIRAIKKRNPCASQPGYTWDNDLKVCVKDGCKNICETDTGDHQKGDCFPDDYCNYSTSEIQYIFDEQKCECVAQCLDDEKIARTIDGKDSTEMQKTESSFEPINKLYCGYECEFSNSTICLDKDSYCGTSIDKNGSILSLGTKAGEQPGCIDMVSGVEICSSDEKIVCDNPYYKCSEAEQEINIPQFNYSTKTYCYDMSKCGVIDPTKKHICRIGTDDCGINNSCEENDIFTQKGIYRLGVCSTTDDIYNREFACQNPKNVGEKKYKSQTSSLEDVAFKVESGYEGVSLNQPQCNLYSPQCKIGEIANNWFCKTGKLTSCNYGDPPGTSCTETPPLSRESENKGNWQEFAYTPNCCDGKYLSTLGNGSFCCPIPSLKDIDGEYLCLNKSAYKPDSSWLELDKKTCSTDENCQIPDNIAKLNNALKTGNSKAKPSQNVSDAEYSNLYCDNGICKFFAGYVDKVAISAGEPQYKARYMVGDDPINSVSEAIYIDVDKTKYQPITMLQNEGQDLNLCSDMTSKNVFGVYDDPSGKPSENTKKLISYTTTASVRKADKSGVAPPITNLECLNYAKQVLPTAFWHSHIKSDGSADLSSIKRSGNECIFTANCYNTDLKTSLDDTGSYNELKWNFGPSDIRQIKGQSIKFEDKSQVQFTTYPKKLHDKWGMCSVARTKSDCEDMYIPSGWTGLEQNFVNYCFWDGDATPPICNEDKHGLGKRPNYLLFPDAHGKQYCEYGLEMNTQLNNTFECLPKK